jgi:hypothetical protein
MTRWKKATGRTLTQYGGYRVQGSKLVFDRVINTEGS